jgi:hypothetical protein
VWQSVTQYFYALFFFGLPLIRGSSSEAKSKNEKRKKNKSGKTVARRAPDLRLLSAAKLLAVSERAAEQKCRSVATRNS